MPEWARSPPSPLPSQASRDPGGPITRATRRPERSKTDKRAEAPAARGAVTVNAAWVGFGPSVAVPISRVALAAPAIVTPTVIFSLNASAPPLPYTLPLHARLQEPARPLVVG